MKRQCRNLVDIDRCRIKLMQGAKQKLQKKSNVKHINSNFFSFLYKLFSNMHDFEINFLTPSLNWPHFKKNCIVCVCRCRSYYYNLLAYKVF